MFSSILTVMSYSGRGRSELKAAKIVKMSGKDTSVHPLPEETSRSFFLYPPSSDIWRAYNTVTLVFISRLRMHSAGLGSTPTAPVQVTVTIYTESQVFSFTETSKRKYSFQFKGFIAKNIKLISYLLPPSNYKACVL